MYARAERLEHIRPVGETPVGPLESARITTVARPACRSGATWPSGTGSRWATAKRTAGMVGPVKGRLPESIS
jgi:hypothetical protein